MLTLGRNIGVTNTQPCFAHVREDESRFRKTLGRELKCLEHKMRIHVALRYHIQVMASYHSLLLDIKPQENIFHALKLLLNRCPLGRCIGHFEDLRRSLPERRAENEERDEELEGVNVPARPENEREAMDEEAEEAGEENLPNEFWNLNVSGGANDESETSYFD